MTESEDDKIYVEKNRQGLIINLDRISESGMGSLLDRLGAAEREAAAEDADAASNLIG